MTWMLEGIPIKFQASEPDLSEFLTPEVWNFFLLGDGGLWDEVLWDTDWRMSEILELPLAAASQRSGEMGLEITVAHSLVHSPSVAEAKMVDYFLRSILWRDGVTWSKQRTK